MQKLINALSIADDDYLIGLSNKGILKRSYKDLESAEVSAKYTDSSAVVSVMGEKCTLVSPLGESKCTCPSRSICRHIITSILWLKNNVANENSDNKENEEKADESSEQKEKKEIDKSFIDELSSYSLKAIQKAMKKQYYTSFIIKAEKGILPEIEETSILSVKIPDEDIAVRLISPIEYSTCTCHSKDLCKHKAAAILAWQIKHNIVAVNDIKLNEESSSHLNVNDIHETAEYTVKFLSSILSNGIVRASENMVEEAESTAVMCHNSRLADCERIMREIGNRLRGYIGRSAEFNADILFSLIMDNITLLRKILKTDDEKELLGFLGEFKSAYVVSDTIEIIPVAQRHFSSAAGYEGEIYYFLNKNTNSENKFFSYSDIRPTFYEQGRRSRISAAPWGLYGNVNEIIKSELKLKSPKISNGKLSSSNETKAEIIGNVNLNQSAVYESIYTDFYKMIFDIFSKNSNSDIETERLVFVSPEKCVSSISDEITQSHSIVIEDKYNRQLTIKTKYKNESKDFFSRLSRIGDMMIENPEKRYVIFANAYIENGRCYLYPIAIFDNIDFPSIYDASGNSSDKDKDININCKNYSYFSELFYNIQKLLCDIIQCGINSFELYEHIKDYSIESQKMGLLILSDKLNALNELLTAKNHTYNNDNSKIIALLSEIYNYLSIGIKQTEFKQAIENLNKQECD